MPCEGMCREGWRDWKYETYTPAFFFIDKIIIYPPNVVHKSAALLRKKSSEFQFLRVRLVPFRTRESRRAAFCSICAGGEKNWRNKVKAKNFYDFSLCFITALSRWEWPLKWQIYARKDLLRHADMLHSTSLLNDFRTSHITKDNKGICDLYIHIF